MPLSDDIIKMLQKAASKGTSSGATHYGVSPFSLTPPPRAMPVPGQVRGSDWTPGSIVNNRFGPPQSPTFPSGLGPGRQTNTPWGPGVQARPSMGGMSGGGASATPPPTDPMEAIRQALGQHGLSPGRANLGGGAMPGAGGPPKPPGSPPGLPVPGGGMPPSVPPGVGGGPPYRGNTFGGGPSPRALGAATMGTLGAGMIGADKLMGNDPMMGAPSSGTLGGIAGAHASPSPLTDSPNASAAPPPMPPPPATPPSASPGQPPSAPLGAPPPPPNVPTPAPQGMRLPTPRPQAAPQHIPTPKPRPPTPLTPSQVGQLKGLMEAHQQPNILKFLMGPKDARGQQYQEPFAPGLPASYMR